MRDYQRLPLTPPASSHMDLAYGLLNPTAPHLKGGSTIRRLKPQLQ